MSSPQIVGDTLYVGSTDADLYAYDARGVRNCTAGVCRPLWRAPMGGAVRSSPAVAAGVVYVGADDGRLAAVDAAGTTGCTAGVCDPLWYAVTGGPIQSSPAIAAGAVYVGSDDGRLDVYDAAGSTGCSGSPRVCAPLWSAVTGGPVVADPAIAEGRVVVASDDGSLRAYDAAGRASCAGTPRTCRPLWQASMGGAVRGSPAIAGGIVYAGATNGMLGAFDLLGARQCAGTPLACSPLWSDTLDAAVSAPSVSHGQLLVAAGGLHVYRVVVAPAAPGLDTATLTSERADTYDITFPDPERASAHANLANVGGNTRVTFSRPSDGTGTDLESCATWTSDASWHNQEGAALRVHHVTGGVKAITVTKNIVYAANWIFNVHVWDTSRSPIATQIAKFDLEPVFFPNQQLVPMPWTLCARVVGSTVSFVVWPTSEPRPAWGDPSHGGSVTLPPGYDDPGAAGWYIGHLDAGDRAELADLAAGPLATAGAGPSGAAATPARAPTAVASLP